MKYKHILLTLLLSACLFAERGDLVSYDFLDDIDKNTAQNVVDSFLPIAPNIVYDLEMYRISYETIDQFGNQTIASGAIVIPVNQLETLPLLSFHHGTQVKRSSTYSNADAFDVLTAFLGGRGYVSVFPDYLGLGVSDVFHPYQINTPSATSVVDILIASKQFCEIKFLNEKCHFKVYYLGGAI